MSVGDINAANDGISLQSSETGNVTVEHEGEIDALGGEGIYAASGDGDVEVSKTGTVTAELDAVTATSVSGSAKVVQTGVMTSDAGKGVVVTSGDSSATL